MLYFEKNTAKLISMSIINNYGDHYGDRDHQFVMRGVSGRTQIITINCNIISAGGDTLALWDSKNGMYYHENCLIKGYTDNFCPRGWAYITDSKIETLKVTVALWHDGHNYESQKLVVVNSKFTGANGYYLGRRHYDASFYLIGCHFSSNMSTKPIFRVTYPDKPSKNKANNWGDRYYYYQYKKEGELLSWMENNLFIAKGSPHADDITAQWTFDGKWHPIDYLNSIMTDIDIVKNLTL